MSTPEEWRPAPGFTGCYEISNRGAVRSLSRTDSRGNRVHSRVLAQYPTASGHLRVSLCRNATVSRVFVHRLVLEAFVSAAPSGLEACHNDGNPTNNTVANLRWDTKSANARDRRRHGTDDRVRRTHCPSGHEYSQDNTYFTTEGWRICRTCRLAGQKAKRDRAREKKAA